jgi:lipid II:glycine glycyltransferase (peptidoglycan interpeptide bridge formation enzyme)
MMPNYLLQWEAIRWAKSQGCLTYDLWGAPEELQPQDTLWGVYRFKQGFGAEYRSSIGAWDYSTRPLLRWLFVTAMPRILALMRARRRALTRRLVD